MPAAAAALKFHKQWDITGLIRKVILATSSRHCAGVSFLSMSERSESIRHESENGAAAALTYAVEVKKGVVLAADLDLPKVPTNRSWYAIWLMVAERKGTSQLPAMLQVGLIRWDQSNFRMQPFIATEFARQDIHFVPIPRYTSGPHRMAIQLTSPFVSLSMDGSSVLSEPRARFFQNDSTIYLKIAGEVLAVGNAVSGVVKNVRLLSGTDQERVAVSRAAFEDRGCVSSALEMAIGNNRKI